MVQSAVENAFRTQLSAAGPVVQRGLLVIRKIDLGPVATRRDQLALNRRLAAILQDAARQAGRLDVADHANCNAVLFPDPLHPWLQVARCAGAGKAVPASWPWRAVLGEVLFAPREQLIAELVTRQFDKPQAGPAVRAVLLALGEALPQVAPQWPPLMLERVLAAICSGGTARAEIGPEGPKLEQIARDFRSLAAHRPFVAALRRWQGRDESGFEAFAVQVALSLGASGRPAPRDRVEFAARSLLAIIQLTGGANLAARLLPALARHCEMQVLARQQSSQTLPAPPIAGPSARALADGFVASIEGSLRLPAIVRRESAAAPGVPDYAVDEAATALHPEPLSGFLPTRHAGIVYLIALIDRYFGRWLGRGDHLAVATGQHLLSRIMARLGRHSDDPAGRFLAALGSLPECGYGPLPFALGAEMLSGIVGPVRIAPIAGHGRWRLALLGRLAIACWQGPAPASVRTLLRGSHSLRRARPVAWSADAMLASCEIGLRRYLRSQPRLRMAQLVQRDGEIASTPTHLDIAFDASVIELAIRRWALDVSPGWCPWLWRVVTIHYDFGPADAG